MPHGRGQVQYVEMGFTRDGTIVGLHCRMIGDAGAYGGFGGGLAMGPTRTMAQGVYRIPKIAYDVGRRGHQHHPDGGVPGRRAGPRRPPSSSGSWTWPPTNSTSTRSRSGGATSCRPTSSPTRP